MPLIINPSKSGAMRQVQTNRLQDYQDLINHYNANIAIRRPQKQITYLNDVRTAIENIIKKFTWHLFISQYSQKYFHVIYLNADVHASKIAKETGPNLLEFIPLISITDIDDFLEALAPFTKASVAVVQEILTPGSFSTSATLSPNVFANMTSFEKCLNIILNSNTATNEFLDNDTLDDMPFIKTQILNHQIPSISSLYFVNTYFNYIKKFIS